jgi:hypothetical protein
MRTLCILTFLALPVCSQDAFRPLFDGKTLDGWDGDSRLWSVRDGAIVGSTDKTPISHNSFLIYRKSEFSNFELHAEAKLRNHNSGIQFRSEALDDYVVRGYQADMAEGNWWGSIYDEKGTRGVLVNGWKGKAEKVVKPNDWNSIDVTCNGDHIQVRLNGLLTADLHDSARLSGIIALQLHMGPPMEVAFRNIRIKEIH